MKKRTQLSEKSKYLDGIVSWIFGCDGLAARVKINLECAQQMKEEAENKLKELKAEKEVCEKNIDKILQDNIERLEKMGIDVM